MATWKQERAEEFAEECEEWGVTITRNGLSAVGTKTPDVIDSMMQPANYHTNIRATFSLLREDFNRLDLVGPSRKKFSCNGKNYEWQKVADDSADATIQFVSYELK